MSWASMLRRIASIRAFFHSSSGKRSEVFMLFCFDILDFLPGLSVVPIEGYRQDLTEE
jgi:hypothetical protein